MHSLISFCTYKIVLQVKQAASFCRFFGLTIVEIYGCVSAVYTLVQTYNMSYQYSVDLEMSIRH